MVLNIIKKGMKSIWIDKRHMIKKNELEKTSSIIKGSKRETKLI